MAEKTAKHYISYLDRYLKRPLVSPLDLEDIIEEIEEETKGGKLRWFSAATSHVLNFYIEWLKFPKQLIQPYKDVLKWEKSGTDKIVPTDEDIIEANEHFRKILGNDEYLIFLLLVFSGLRLKHIVKMLNTYDPRRLEVFDTFARYNMEGLGGETKEAYECYMPIWLAKQLRYMKCEYTPIRDKINYKTRTGKPISSRYIRKWTNNFLFKHGVPKDVRNFILGRRGEIEGSVEAYNYLDLRSSADKWYAKVVDKFPIKN